MIDLSDKKRKLPRHIDGRIKVGMLPLKNFFLILPLAIVIIVFVILYFSPVIFFIGVFLLGIIIGIASEFHQKETGLSIIKDIISYAISGDKYFERKSSNVSFNKRFTWNKIKG
ncbi:MAG: hypothetical protein FJW63_10595 [Actinobacteria bacterium]|nr:hypothetical protein [Actinomycetota bacterium]